MRNTSEKLRPRFIEFAVLVWLIGWTALAHANTSLTEDFATYDYASLGISLGAGLFGGLGRTLLALLRRATLVGDTKFLLLRDLCVSAICGAIVYVLIQGYNELPAQWTALPKIGKDMRLLLLLAGGYAPNWAFSAIRKGADEVVSRAHKAIRGDDDPITQTAPLGDK